MIYIGSDHGGFKLKEDLKKFLKRAKWQYVDVGAKKLVKDDDFTPYTTKVSKAVQKNPAKNKGILICRSGQGVCIAANRFKHVRAALAWNEHAATHSRHDDDANVLCLPSDFISTETAEDIVWFWLTTKFSFEKRFIRRIKEINNLK